MNAEDYSKLGDKCFSEKNFDGAIMNYTEAIKLEPDDPFNYSERGHAHIQKKELDLAIADFSKAIQLEPNKFGDFYAYRGGAYVLKGNKDLAISDFEMAMKTDPQNKDYREALEELKNGKTPPTVNVSSSNPELIKHIIFMVVGGVIGGVIGFSIGFGIIGLLIGIFVGIGLRPFLQGVKEFFIDGLKVWGEQIKDSIAELGIFTGFFKGLFWGAVGFIVIGFFVLLWKTIKSPFVAIYQLVTGNYEFDYL